MGCKLKKLGELLQKYKGNGDKFYESKDDK